MTSISYMQHYMSGNIIIIVQVESERAYMKQTNTIGYHVIQPRTTKHDILVTLYNVHVTQCIVTGGLNKLANCQVDRIM